MFNKWISNKRALQFKNNLLMKSLKDNRMIIKNSIYLYKIVNKDLKRMSIQILKHLDFLEYHDQ